MLRLSEKIISDAEKYREALQKFLKGELTSAFFRGIRVPWGFYSQRGGKLLMARLRIPAGILIPSQAKAIAECARMFATGDLHITTRQDIQIHNLLYENSIKVIDFLIPHNISPRGGGGNTVRNITACPLSGICEKEKIEVYRFSLALTHYFLNLDESFNLPRKFKIAFSGCEKDCAFSGVNDVGFIALDGKFRVLCGGGMGARPSVGRILDEVGPEDGGYVLKAVLNVFNKYGDRRNRHHNRLRFFIQDKGWSEFLKLYREELKRVKDEEFIPLELDYPFHSLPPAEKSLPPAVEERFFKTGNLGRQKQKGYYFIKVRIPRGEITSEKLIAVSEILSIVPHLILRTTQRQNLILSNIPGEKVQDVYERLEEIFGESFLYPDTLIDLLTCKGATTCNLGLCNSMGLAEELEKVLLEVKEEALKLQGVSININGCPNACGHHPIGIISLSGLTRKVYNRTAPFYRIFVNGFPACENTVLSQEIGMIPARSVPSLIRELITIMFEEKRKGREPVDFLRDDGKEFLRSLVKKYSFIPPVEEDRTYYIDFGRTEEFSLQGLSQGECGAGVIDMIEADLSSAKQSLIIAREKGYNEENIRETLLYSARALLVLKGIDPRTVEETLSSFVEAFVNGGIASPDFSDLPEFYRKLMKGEVPGEKAYSYATRLFEEVKEIYSSMDSNFNLPVRYGEKHERVMEKTSTVYDLRGTPCPINFVKAKLKLEGMKDGEILEIYLDEGEPVQNVPKSLEGEGHRILKIEGMENWYRVVVMKKGGER